MKKRKKNQKKRQKKINFLSSEKYHLIRQAVNVIRQKVYIVYKRLNDISYRLEVHILDKRSLLSTSGNKI